MILTHPRSKISGTVDATSVHPDGRQIVRINDHWLFRDECRMSSESASLMEWALAVAFLATVVALLTI